MSLTCAGPSVAAAGHAAPAGRTTPSSPPNGFQTASVSPAASSATCAAPTSYAS
jgi:hypothetical protein